MDDAFKHVDDFADFAHALLSKLQEFTEETVAAIHNAQAKVEEAKVDCGEYGKAFVRDLAETAQKTHNYVDAVDDLYWHGRDRDRIRRVKEGVTNGDFGELKDFIRQLENDIAKCEEKYQEAREAYIKIETSSDRAAGYCDKRRKKNRKKKNATRAVGGTAAAGSLAAGVAATGVTISAIAGAFTLGAGAIVGLGITAGATAVAGVTAGVITHLIASDFAELQKEFEGLRDSFNSVNASASRVLEQACCVRSHLETISRSIDNVERVWNTHEMRSSINTELDHLCEKFGEYYVKSSECRDKTKIEEIKYIKL